MDVVEIDRHGLRDLVRAADVEVVRPRLDQVRRGEPHDLPGERRIDEAVPDRVAVGGEECGVQGVGENDRKFSGVRTSVQRSYNVMFWKISS